MILYTVIIYTRKCNVKDLLFNYLPFFFSNFERNSSIIICSKRPQHTPEVSVESCHVSCVHTRHGGAPSKTSPKTGISIYSPGIYLRRNRCHNPRPFFKEYKWLGIFLEGDILNNGIAHSIVSLNVYTYKLWYNFRSVRNNRFYFNTSDQIFAVFLLRIFALFARDYNFFLGIK